MSKKLIASDFDGTFYRNGQISTNDRKLIKKWQESGRYFGIVTGRGLNFFQTVKEKKFKPDFLILYNGALVADGDGNTIHEDFIPRDVFEEIKEIFKQNPDGCLHYDKTGDEDFYHQYYATYENYEQALAVADIINNQLGDKVNAVVNGVHVNIGKKGATKANGVRHILAHYGLSEDEGAVVGDDYNDLDMLKQLDGWAMATGRSEVKAQANHICFSVGSLAKKLMK